MEKTSASFENKLEELEKIVSELEEGNVPIDKMFLLYEKGKKLYQECSDILSSYESRIDGGVKND